MYKVSWARVGERVNYWFHYNVVNHDILWWIRHKIDPHHSYNTVNLNLNPAYYDVDTRMEFAVFEIMNEFVQVQLVHVAEELLKELPPVGSSMQERGRLAIIAHINIENEWSAGQPTATRFYSELLDVYNWFHLNKLSVTDRTSRQPKDSTRSTMAFEEEVEMHMIKIIKLRGGMFT